MTKAITDELGLPSLQDALKQIADEGGEAENPEVTQMANALQAVDPKAIRRAEDPTGVDEHVDEADVIYEAAMQSHKDLMDLGFNIEPKHAGANAFTPGLKALEIALKASESKKKAKMDRIRAVMEQEAHQRDMGKDAQDGEILEGGGGSITANRNDLMAKIRSGEI
jgi:hypothetical protein